MFPPRFRESIAESYNEGLDIVKKTAALKPGRNWHVDEVTKLESALKTLNPKIYKLRNMEAQISSGIKVSVLAMPHYQSQAHRYARNPMPTDRRPCVGTFRKGVAQGLMRRLYKEADTNRKVLKEFLVQLEPRLEELEEQKELLIHNLSMVRSYACQGNTYNTITGVTSKAYPAALQTCISAHAAISGQEDRTIVEDYFAVKEAFGDENINNGEALADFLDRNPNFTQYCVRNNEVCRPMIENALSTDMGEAESKFYASLLGDDLVTDDGQHFMGNVKSVDMLKDVLRTEGSWERFQLYKKWAKENPDINQAIDGYVTKTEEGVDEAGNPTTTYPNYQNFKDYLTAVSEDANARGLSTDNQLALQKGIINSEHLQNPEDMLAVKGLLMDVAGAPGSDDPLVFAKRIKDFGLQKGDGDNKFDPKARAIGMKIFDENFDNLKLVTIESIDQVILENQDGNPIKSQSTYCFKDFFGSSGDTIDAACETPITNNQLRLARQLIDASYRDTAEKALDFGIDIAVEKDPAKQFKLLHGALANRDGMRLTDKFITENHNLIVAATTDTLKQLCGDVRPPAFQCTRTGEDGKSLIPVEHYNLANAVLEQSTPGGISKVLDITAATASATSGETFDYKKLAELAGNSDNLGLASDFGTKNFDLIQASMKRGLADNEPVIREEIGDSYFDLLNDVAQKSTAETFTSDIALVQNLAEKYDENQSQFQVINGILRDPEIIAASKDFGGRYFNTLKPIAMEHLQAERTKKAMLENGMTPEVHAFVVDYVATADKERFSNFIDVAAFSSRKVEGKGDTFEEVMGNMNMGEFLDMAGGPKANALGADLVENNFDTFQPALVSMIDKNREGMGEARYQLAHAIAVDAKQEDASEVVTAIRSVGLEVRETDLSDKAVGLAILRDPAAYGITNDLLEKYPDATMNAAIATVESNRDELIKQGYTMPQIDAMQLSLQASKDDGNEGLRRVLDTTHNVLTGKEEDTLAASMELLKNPQDFQNAQGVVLENYETYKQASLDTITQNRAALIDRGFTNAQIDAAQLSIENSGPEGFRASSQAGFNYLTAEDDLAKRNALTQLIEHPGMTDEAAQKLVVANHETYRQATLDTMSQTSSDLLKSGVTPAQYKAARALVANSTPENSRHSMGMAHAILGADGTSQGQMVAARDYLEANPAAVSAFRETVTNPKVFDPLKAAGLEYVVNNPASSNSGLVNGTPGQYVEIMERVTHLPPDVVPTVLKANHHSLEAMIDGLQDGYETSGTGKISGTLPIDRAVGNGVQALTPGGVGAIIDAAPELLTVATNPNIRIPAGTTIMSSEPLTPEQEKSLRVTKREVLNSFSQGLKGETMKDPGELGSFGSSVGATLYCIGEGLAQGCAERSVSEDVLSRGSYLSWMAGNLIQSENVSQDQYQKFIYRVNNYQKEVHDLTDGNPEYAQKVRAMDDSMNLLKTFMARNYMPQGFVNDPNYGNTNNFDLERNHR